MNIHNFNNMSSIKNFFAQLRSSNSDIAYELETDYIYVCNENYNLILLYIYDSQSKNLIFEFNKEYIVISNNGNPKIIILNNNNISDNNKTYYNISLKFNKHKLYYLDNSSKKNYFFNHLYFNKNSIDKNKINKYITQSIKLNKNKNAYEVISKKSLFKLYLYIALSNYGLPIKVNFRHPNISILNYPKIKSIGMDNLGNTCFCNSSLQALFNIKIFTNELLNNFHHVRLNELGLKGNRFLYEFLYLYIIYFSMSINIIDGNILNMNIFVNFMKLNLNELFNQEQQDAQEYIIMILDNIEKGNNKLIDIFQINTKIIKRCLECNYTRYSYEKENMLILSISQINLSSNKTLSNLLKYFYESEETVDYTCEKCGHNKAKKSDRLFHLPKVLIFVLSRSDVNNKNNIFIHFNLIENIGKYINDNEIEYYQYKLNSIILHSGSKNSGHYKCLCFDDEKKICYLYNDSNVIRRDYKDINDINLLYNLNEPYILIYRLIENNDFNKK
jgi:ubiquitin C-terminal hydrolase